MGPKGDVHPLIWHRALCAKEDRLGGLVLGQLADHPSLRKLAEVAAPQFFKTVSFGPDDPPEERMEAVAGRRALGDQQRWAVVAMDGNDMGRQFRAAQEAGWSDSEFSKWLREMSECLKTCTQRAFLAALGSAIKSWGETLDDDRREECVYEDDEGRHLVLPFRPLVLGGDDVVMLCHPGFAIEFVRDMAEEFQKQSKEAAAGSAVRPLWVATGDELTISGGVLFSKVTFPLHMAIPYAESLLANAKARYRRDPKAAPTSAMAAAVDWDTITDTLVDTPKARRDRELRFFDEELSKEVRLTRRPYPLTATGDSMTLEHLLELKNQLGRLPTSLRARILPALQRPWSERIEFVASVAKRHPVLKEQLWEGEGDMGKAWVSSEDGAQITALPDALLLLEEEHRAERRQ